jgi:hypothetical protein
VLSADDAEVRSAVATLRALLGERHIDLLAVVGTAHAGSLLGWGDLAREGLLLLEHGHYLAQAVSQARGAADTG